MFYSMHLEFCLQYVDTVLLSSIWIVDCPNIFQWIGYSFLIEL